MKNHLKEQHVIDLGEKVLKEIKLRNSFKDNFNIFKALQIERKEVDLHSWFLYELWNPKGSHGLGATFLEIFIRQLLEDKNIKIDCSAAIVEREYPIENNRRIDFVLENIKIDGKAHNFLFEMKVDAGDQKNQLEDYYNFGVINYNSKKNQENKFTLYYLTLDGYEASEYSTGKISSDDYKQISFEEHILDFIKKSIKEVILKPSLREVLEQYRKTILNICGLLEEEEKNIMKEFLLEGDNLQIIDELSKAIPEAKAEIELKFWNELTEEIGENVYNFSREEGYERYTLKEVKENYLQLPYWSKEYNGIYLNIFMERGKNFNDLYLGIQICDNDGNKIKTKKNREEIEKLLNNNKIVFKKSKYLFWWFCKTNLSYKNESFYKLKDNTKRKEIISKVKTEIYDIINFFYKHEEELNKIMRLK